MSEPSSLYLQIPIKAAQRQAFLEHPIVPAGQYTDWLSWLDRKKFHGSITQADIEAWKYPEQNTGDYLTPFLTGPFDGNSQASYDAEKELWTISVLEFSENYFDFIRFLGTFRVISQYMKTNLKAGEEGFVLIQDFLWDASAESDVCLQLTTEGSNILESTPPVYLETAKQAWQTHLDHIQEQWKD